MIAVAVLFRAFFTAVPGMVWFNLIGVAVLLASFLNDDPMARRVFVLAAGFFLMAFPALFAGSRFRQMASRRTHLMLPGFASRLLVATWALFVYLAMVGGVLGASATLAVLLFAALSALFWFGFLPGLWRFLSGSVVVGFAVPAGEAIVPAAPVALALALLGWVLFAFWFRRRVDQRIAFEVVEKSDWNLPLALDAPWANHIGTPDGTLLLGTGDAWRSRFARAAFGVLFIPLVLLAAFVLIGGMTVESVFGTPMFLFIALAYALGMHAHLSGRIADRRRLVWLRVDGGRAAVSGLADRVALGELAALAAALVLLLAASALMSAHGPGKTAIGFAMAWLAAAVTITCAARIPGLSPVARGWLTVAVFAVLAIGTAVLHLQAGGTAMGWVDG